MTDINNIYNILLSRRYQDTLFQELKLHGFKGEKGGRETLVDCPRCGKEKKFSYSSEKPVFRCWSSECDFHGDWLHYLTEHKGYEFREALNMLAKEAGVEMTGFDQAKHQVYTRKADILEAAHQILAQSLYSPAGADVLDYLYARGYTDADIKGDGNRQLGMEIGAHVGRGRLQKALLSQGYTIEEIRNSGLLTGGYGETHKLSILFRDQAGRAIGISVRAIDDAVKPKYKYSAGFEKTRGMIGFTHARGMTSVIAVEGVLDAAYLTSRGFRVIALGGTDISPEQIKALESSGTKELRLALDQDEAGRTGTERNLRALLRSSLRTYIVTWPQDCKDPDELVRKHGNEALLSVLTAERWSKWLAKRIASKHEIHADIGIDRALAEAADWMDYIHDKIDYKDFRTSLEESLNLSAEEIDSRLIKQARQADLDRAARAMQMNLKQAMEKVQAGDLNAAEILISDAQVEAKSSRGSLTVEPYLVNDFLEDISRTTEGLDIGFETMSDYVMIPRGAITIIAGRPGHGKTTMQLNVLVNLIKRYPERSFHLYSYEEPKSRLALKIMMILSGHAFSQNKNQADYIRYFKHNWSGGAVPSIENAVKTFDQWTREGRLLITDKMMAAEDLAATIAHACRTSDVGGVFVDYIQKIPVKQKNPQRYLEIKHASEQILRVAVAHDVPIILGAQLGRGKESSHDRKVKLDNLRESGDIEQDSALVLGIYNPTAQALEDSDDKGNAERIEGVVDMEVYVLKQRGAVNGKKFILDFDQPVLKIKDKDIGISTRYKRGGTL